MPIYKVDGVIKDGKQKYKVRVNYMSNSGQAKQLTRMIYGSEEAKDLERELIRKIKEEGENPAAKMTVQELYEEYVAAKKFEIRESSLDKIMRNYRIYVKPTMANVRIDKLTLPMLQKWKLSIEEKGLALRTKQHAYAQFRTILYYAVKMEYIPKNPLATLGTFRDALHTRPEMDIFTAEEFMAFIATAKRQAEERQTQHHDLSEWEFYVFFNIAFFTGLRKGEIHALKWSDIDGSLLHVRRSITQKLKGDDRETPPKSKKSVRTLQMPSPLLKVLAEHRARQERLDRFSENFRVCGGERSLRDSTIEVRNKRYADLSGLTRIRIHDFRHSHVSVLANEGINIQEIARRLGHAKVEMTWNTYSHLYPREEEKAVDILNRIA